MRLIASLLVAACSNLVPVNALAEEGSAGQQHYAVCVSCHGAQAEGSQALGAPRLNHLAPVYIAAQLEKFRSGQRGGEDDTSQARSMAAIAATLSGEQAIHEVADYVASLESPPSAATVSGDANLGADYYQQLCGACHGADGQGNRALHSPRLAGSDDWYLERQLQAFRSGTRGANPADSSGRQMRAMATTLPDEQAIRDVVSYLHSLSR